LIETTTSTQTCISEATIACARDVDISLVATNSSITHKIKLAISNDNTKDLSGVWFRGTKLDGSSSIYTSSTGGGTPPFPEQVLTTIKGYGTTLVTYTFLDEATLRATNQIEVIPIIHHVTDDGNDCDMQCTQKAKKAKFAWTINN